MIGSAPFLSDRVLGHAAVDAELTALYRRMLPSVVQITGGNGNGAGTIWHADGLVVTNAHVAGPRDRLRVILHDNRSFEGNVVARDQPNDLALVEIEAADLPAVAIGDSTRIRPGQFVMAIGHPHGQTNTMTAGIIIAGARTSRKNGSGTDDLVQIDARIAPGSSGGPLLDIEGRVLGINTRVSGRLSMAIPSATVERFVATWAPGGAHAWLGLTGVLAVLPNRSQQMGFVVTGLAPDGPAESAGIMIGDVLLAIAGDPIVDPESVPAALLRARPGEPIDIAMLRGGIARSCTIVPGEPARPGRGPSY